MTNRPALIKQSDVKRIAKGLLEAGVESVRIEVEGNKVAFVSVSNSGVSESRAIDPLETWRRENDQN